MRSGTRARRPVAPGPQEPSTIEEIPAMQLPQTPERIKEVPAQALRAVFAGVGQVLLITERVRRPPIGQVLPGPFWGGGSSASDGADGSGGPGGRGTAGVGTAGNGSA